MQSMVDFALSISLAVDENSANLGLAGKIELRRHIGKLNVLLECLETGLLRS